MTGRDWFQLILLALLWGLSFFFTEICLRDIGPLTLAAGRVSSAALALLALARLTGCHLPAKASDWGALAVMGVLNNALPFALIMWGQTSITSGLASILNATTPLFTFLLAHLLTADEKMSSRGLGGVLIGFCGAVVLIGPGALDGLGAGSWGQIAVLAAALCYACSGIFGRRLRHLAPAVAAAGMTGAASLVLLPLAALIEQPWSARPDAATWSALLSLGLFSTAAAYILYFRILASAGATNLLLVTFLIPIAALLLGTVFLGEEIPFAALVGMALIFAGLAIIDGRPLRLLRRPGSPKSGSATGIR